MNELIIDLIQKTGVPLSFQNNILLLINTLLLVALVWFIMWISKRVVLTFVDKVVRNSKVKWDDVFLENKVFRSFSYLVPLIAIDYLTPLFYKHGKGLISFIDVATDVAAVWAIYNIVTRIITSVVELSKGADRYVSIALQSLSQLVKLFIAVIAIIVTVSILLNINLSSIFGALGAMTAILLLVFKDTILGFVASIQIATTKMVSLGDWVAIPSYNADGPLLELNLVTAKIKNWDNTITTIPTYSLITSSVKNWEGMVDDGARRIKRSLNFDVKSVRFLTDADVERFNEIELLKGHVDSKNGKTNLGVFRKYAELLLMNNPVISKKHTLMVRQLQTSQSGIPLEVYCFSLDTGWVNYENIQADILDQLIASANMFDLNIFQNPSGDDLVSLKK
ncbi:MAG: mechanosensitive ion channel [Ichthyobacteriaceae bacterium]|nr:mechanosensitive ion channel [Ichthyobacteriaceae bacterium]